MDNEAIPGVFVDGSCRYCNHTWEEKDWNSEWCENNDRHYKGLTCSECGKKDRVPVTFEGSGHDNVASGKESVLESTVKLVSME